MDTSETQSLELERFLDIENFRHAWRIIRNSDRFETKDRFGIEIFSAQTDIHLEILIEQLRKQNYSPESSRRIYLPKADKTLRTFGFLSIYDRLVYQAIGNIILENSYSDLNKYTESVVFAHVPHPPDKNGKFSDYVFRPTLSNKKRIGQFDKFKDAITAHIRMGYEQSSNNWMIQTDLASYYPSIDHILLMQLLKHKLWLTDEYLLEILVMCLTTWASYEHNPINRGIPIGYEVSDLLGTLFLLDIDELLSSKHKMLRFVDDIYLFVEGEDEARRLLIEFDLMLQRKALIRNSTKSELEACDEYRYNQQVLYNKLQKKLSFITRHDENVDSSQENLYSLFFEIYDDQMLTDAKNIAEHESTFARILYRLQIKDNIVKNLALKMLTEFPARAFNVAQYLSLFIRDSEVVKTLWIVVISYPEYTRLRIYCLQALREMSGFSNDQISELISWIMVSDDWYFRRECFELISEDLDEDQIQGLINQENDTYVRAYMATRLFSRIEDIQRRTEIINVVFCTEGVLSKIVGIYLWRRGSAIPRKNLVLNDISEDFDKLLLSSEEQNAGKRFFSHFYDYFEFKINKNLRLHEIFNDLETANQHLINVLDAGTNIKSLIIPLYEIVFQITYFSVKINNPQIIAYDNMTELWNHVDAKIRVYLQELRIGRAKIEKNEKLDYPNIRLIRLHTTIAVALLLEKIHNHYNLQVHKTLKEFLNEIERKRKMSTQRSNVFISYNHKDKDWLDRIQAALKPEFRGTNFVVWDDRQIKPGDKWREKIDEALARAKVGILLVSVNFAASDFISEKELPVILEAVEAGDLKLVWIAVGASSYKKLGLEPYQSANSDPAKPLNSLKDSEIDAELVKIADFVRKQFDDA